MKIVSAEVKLIPRPPALVERRNTKCGESGAFVKEGMKE